MLKAFRQAAAPCLAVSMTVFLLCCLQPGCSTAWAEEALETEARPPASLIERLRHAGFTFQLTYTGEIKRGSGLVPDDTAEYRGLIELNLNLDTGQSGLWPNGGLFITGQNGHGNSVSIEPGGNVLPISDIDAGNFTQISQYGLDQGAADNRLRVVAGKQDANRFLCVNDYGGRFLFPSYTLIPTVPLPTFPAPALGLTVLGQPADRTYLRAGGYDGAPQVGSSGWDTLFDGSGGYLFAVEPGFKPAWGGHGGNYRWGLWYHTGESPDLRRPESHSGNYGVYLLIDQEIFREATSKGGPQGLGVFFQVGWAPEDRNAANRHVGVGLAYSGLLPGRDKDELGLAASFTRLTAIRAGPEDADLVNAELYYNIVLDDALSLQPDVQYFKDPGTGRGTGWAFNLRWVLSF